MRRGGAKKRRDASEPGIVAVLVASGWSVERLHAPNAPDLLCGAYGWFVGLAECKSGTETVTAGQHDWHARWRGRPVVTLRTAADAERWVRTVVRGARDQR